MFHNWHHTTFSALILAIFSLSTVFAQSTIDTVSLLVDLEAPDDSGWISLYNGTNHDHWFVQAGTNVSTTKFRDFTPEHPNDNNKDNPFYNPAGDTIHSTGTKGFHIIHKQDFSHYRLKFQYQFPSGGGNAGMLVHAHELAPFQENGDYWLYQEFPRSIEAQGQLRGFGEAWCIGNVWVDVRVDAGTQQYNPDGVMRTLGGENYGNRQIFGDNAHLTSNSAEINDNWVDMEIESHGSDSISHFIEGHEVIRYYNPRVHQNRTDPDSPIEEMIDHGKLGFQSEGAQVRYRNFFIKLFPEDPIYDDLYTADVPGCTDPLYEEYDENATVDDGSCATLPIVAGFNKSTPNITYLQNSFLIKMEEQGKLNVVIKNVQGQTVNESSFTASEGKRYSRSDFLPGLYFVELNRQGNVSVERLLLY